MRFALISVVVNIVAGLALFGEPIVPYHLMGIPFQGIGVAGIAAGTAIASWLNVAQMFVALHRRGDYSLSKPAASRLARILLASLFMGAGLFVAERIYVTPELKAQYLQPVFGGIDINVLHRHVAGLKELSLAAVSLAGVLLYFVLLFAFGGVKPSELKGALTRRGGRIETAEETMGKTPAGPDLL
jgi:putative peptidoglycan lipid II flippase